jgi:hypothetical protein
MINRRELLAGAAAAAAAVNMPMPAVAATVEAAAPVDKAVWWCVGTPGEYNGMAIRVETEAQAIAEWGNSYFGLSQCEAMTFDHAPAPPEACECDFCTMSAEASKVPTWDKLVPKDREPTPAEWLQAGFGAICQNDKCGYEIDPCHGGGVGDGKALCEDCYQEWRKLHGRKDPDDDNGIEESMAEVAAR